MRMRLRLLVGVLTAAMAVLTVDWAGGVAAPAAAAAPSSIAVGATPFGVAFSPDGSRAYVADLSAGAVSVIDTATDAVVGTASLIAGSAPYGVAVSPDGSRVYVTDETDGRVQTIDTATDAVVGTPITVGPAPYGVAVSPDGSRVYVANSGGSTVSVIDTATDAVATITVGNYPASVAVSPDGSRVYVANSGSGTVSVIDTATETVVGAPMVGFHPYGVAVSPDGSRIYVADNSDNTVSVIDSATETVVGTPIAVGVAPYGIAVAPDGTQVYVTNSGDSTVSVIDTTTDAVTTIAVGGTPYGVAVAPDGSRVYVTNSDDSTVSVIMLTSVPGDPTDVSATAGDGRAVVSWTVPDDGGSAITGYTVTSSPGGASATCTSSPCTVTGLTNGTSYTFTVVATNGQGDGDASAPSNAVTPTGPATTGVPGGSGQQGSQHGSTTSDQDWYRDPLTKAERHRLVPARPGRTGGRTRLTKADYRSHDGALVVPVNEARGHQLTMGEGVQLVGLFRFDSAWLSKAGRHRLATLARSMRNAKAFTCEGYADYAGETGHEQTLSQQRARAVCQVLTHKLGKHLHIMTVGYGPTRPVAVGGTARSRVANRRVDVLVR